MQYDWLDDDSSEDDSSGDIDVPNDIEDFINMFLHRISSLKSQKEHINEHPEYLSKLAHIVDWWEAALTNEELERALFLLGERTGLSPPPSRLSYPKGMLMSPNTCH